MHILAAALFLAHETCNNPVSTLHSKRFWTHHCRTGEPTDSDPSTAVEATATRQYTRRSLQTQVDEVACQDEHIKSVCSNSKTMREIFKIDKMMMIWEALSADRQITLLMKLQSNPHSRASTCSITFQRRDKQTCRKALYRDMNVWYDWSSISRL
jgi:hypothetical protein